METVEKTLTAKERVQPCFLTLQVPQPLFLFLPTSRLSVPTILYHTNVRLSRVSPHFKTYVR